MKRLAAALLLLTTPAMAQDKPVESVTVYGSTLVGMWRGGLVRLSQTLTVAAILWPFGRCPG